MRLILATLLAILALTLPARATELVRVIDGDTIVIQEGKVRLVGIDAFESDQSCLYQGARYPCGEMATRMMENLFSGSDLVCRSPDGGAWEKGYYGRWLLICSVGGIDINASMVASGWALVNPDYDTRYRDLEVRARQRETGAWQGRFVAPWRWRDGARLDPAD